MDTEQIAAYNNSQSPVEKDICETLQAAIDASLEGSTSKLYHGSPVWFIDDNPIVGYDVSAKGVNVLFWSGQSFDGAELKSIGKYKAAGITFTGVDEIDTEKFTKWLTDSKNIQWDYKNIRQNAGKLNRL